MNIKLFSFSFLLFSINAFIPRHQVKTNLNVRYNNIASKSLSILDNNILDFLKNKSGKKYILTDLKNNKMYKFKDFKIKFPDLKKKKLISISPGGYKGFYYMGVILYIKQNYNISDNLLTGASAGAWTSLFASYKYDMQTISEDILEINFKNIESIFEMQLMLKERLLNNYKFEDFNHQNIFIGVTMLRGLELSTNIFFNFRSLEDIIDCCIASSHIPLLTGGLINKFNNEITFDGGFSNYPYLNLNNTVLHINPCIWSRHESINYYDLIFKKKEDYNKLYEKGYYDTRVNKHILDKKLNSNNQTNKEFMVKNE